MLTQISPKARGSGKTKQWFLKGVQAGLQQQRETKCSELDIEQAAIPPDMARRIQPWPPSMEAIGPELAGRGI